MKGKAHGKSKRRLMAVGSQEHRIIPWGPNSMGFEHWIFPFQNDDEPTNVQSNEHWIFLLLFFPTNFQIQCSFPIHSATKWL